MRYNPRWASHLPLLIKIMELSEGPVLEMGMGPFSTPVLHELCLDKDKKLFSYENVLEYFDAGKQFETDWHKITLVKNWDDARIENIHWGLAFIDHEPSERRMMDIKRVANLADYIVVHDTEAKNEGKYKFSEIFSLFSQKRDYTKQIPNTTVLSNFKDLSDLKI